ncbi:MAG: translation initiation factor IF-3 [Bacteroidetes bacterium]|nr:translation initiation factor IF-3 [Bacteroidota bacterium]MBP6426617.1 translation initiation factor IF-3 [Bacteroidia bacterium]MBK8362194.1 translation initiation factor IF-3 [Bacteroidota bacterium]MBK9413133.1 translation initiation factor IF-3 [Bacteroidota bacterium]MBL0033837.1 translation initiation factor IF-3 [Bacteroidota bacterium]
MAAPNQSNSRPPLFNKSTSSRPPYQRGRGPVKKEDEHRINERIRVPQVRLVGDNIVSDIYPTEEALRMAKEQELDLVEIVPTADPPVCRIIEYQKFLYDKKKKEKELKSKQGKQVVKEVRFGPNTDEHDFNFKVKHAMNFLEDGNKVKAYVHFRGRTIAYKEKGEIILLKFAQALEEYGKVELLPKLEGNRMFIHLAPIPRKKSK